MIAFFLGGCAAVPPAPSVDWTGRAAQIAALPSWAARGRIAFKAESGGGQGDLRWEQSGEDARIRVSGPFGAGAYEIRWSPERLSVNSRNGEYSRAWEGTDAASEFLREQLGWSFPATSTRWWLLGVPDPAWPAEQLFTPAGELRSIRQNGWAVTYDRFSARAGIAMPDKLTMENAHARVRLVVDAWCLPPECAGGL